MFDIRAIRKEPEFFDKGWARRGLEPQTPAILKIDEQRRSIQTSLQELQAKRNEESKKIGQIKKEGGDAQAQMDAVAALKDQMSDLEEQERELAEKLKDILSGLPNILSDDVPDGADEDDNKEIHKWGEPRTDHKVEHYDIGEKLGLMDFETAAKMSGSRFVLLSGGIARLERALAQFFLDTHTSEHGYTETSPPLLVRDNALYGTSQLPKFEEDQFECVSELTEFEKKLSISETYSDEFDKGTKILEDLFSSFKTAIKNAEDSGIELSWAKPIYESFKANINNRSDEIAENRLRLKKLRAEWESLKKAGVSRHWMIPTSEVPLTNIVAEMIVEEEYLPRRYTAFTPCFRSEAGSAGKDTRGMLRQHQFYKVEMVSVTTPEKSVEEQERMLECAETVLKKLELPFRTIVLCSGDTGFGAIKTYDIEAWLPGQETYREISSVSNCGDFQARRMNARCRPKGEKETRFVHTLNGSGVAVGRALIAVIENYYDPSDGGIVVPDVLKPYMGGIEKIVKE